MARTKKGWLTAHDLRSGLREQWAVSDGRGLREVELRWVKHHQNFEVSHRTGTETIRASYASLTEARARFDREVRRAMAPSIKKGASR